MEIVKIQTNTDVLNGGRHFQAAGTAGIDAVAKSALDGCILDSAVGLMALVPTIDPKAAMQSVT